MTGQIPPGRRRLIEALEAKGLKFVDRRGDPQRPIVVIGEAPGAEEERLGVAFVGPAGRELESELRAAGIFDKCWYTNPYKTRPPNNDLSRLDELGVPRELFLTEFFEELEEFKPAILLAAGRTAFDVLYPGATKRASVQKHIGSLYESPLLRWPHWVIPMYHPAFILRDYAQRDINIFICRKAAEELRNFKRELPRRELLTNLPSEGIAQYLRDVIAQRAIVSIDIESFRGRLPFTIAIADSPDRAVAFELWRQDVTVFRLLDELLSTNRQVGQNYFCYDLPWLAELGFSVNPDIAEDTLVRHHVLWPELPHRLEFMTMQYTREPYYKDEGRLWRPSDGIQQLLLYNAKDAAVTLEIFFAQEQEFREEECAVCRFSIARRNSITSLNCRWPEGSMKSTPEASGSI